MTTAAQLAHYCADHFPQKTVMTTGLSYMTTLYWSLASAAIAGGLAWYIRGRGLAGVQIDLNNVKTDVENLKTKVFPAPVVVATPVATVTN